MLPFELDERERRILRDFLDESLSELRYEISNTDRLDFREKLKEKKAVLQKVVAELSAVVTAS